jgi:hypothetical protein
MRREETLCEYTNRYFENRNTLAGVKDDDVIAYYKKGITNIKLFEKNHEADAKTIGDFMAYVDKLIDNQDAVMHDFNGEDHDDGGTRSRKRSGEAYVTHPQRPSTFLEGDFNMVMDHQCQFHRDVKHNMRECEQLKRALGVPSTSRRSGVIATTTAMVANTSRIITVDLIDEITRTADPILAMTIGIYMINAATTAAMTDATTTVVTTPLISVINVIVVTIATMIVTVSVLDRQTYQGGTRGSRLCGEDRDRETENSKVCARTRDTRFIQVRAGKVASPTSCLGIKYGALRLVFG